MQAYPTDLPRIAAVVLSTAAITVAQAQSELILEDDFDLPFTADDINEGIGDGRQSGSAAALNYVEDESTAAGGDFDYLTQIYNDGFDSRLALLPLDWTWVSPDRNFVDGPTFSIEFDLNPSVQDPGRLSEDWAAIVFGATSPGMFVNASDGLGVLFRSNGAIQVFDGGSLVHGTTADNPLPADEIHVRLEVTGQSFDGTTDAVVAMFVNDTVVPLAEESDTYTRVGGFQANHLTLQGYATAGNAWEYWFDNLSVRADTCVRLDPAEIFLDTTPDGPISIDVKVPEGFNDDQGGTVTLSSSNPDVVTLAGATDNSLSVEFVAGGPISKAVDLIISGKGRAQIHIATDSADCVGGPATVLTPLSAHVRNPSFESPYNPDWPHYSAIDDWEGGSGINESDGPFHDNSAIPDRARVGFLQGTSSLSQQVTGLIAGETYWLQLRYNSRNCCGGETPDMTVSVDGVVLGTEAGIQSAGGSYYFRSFEFTALDEVALIEISTQPNAGGDSTLLIDAVTVVQRGPGNVVVRNPSFEASGLIPLPGVFDDALISGWTADGMVGLNLSGDPYANNGETPDQDLVAFVNGVGDISQTLTGLIPGETYQVEFAYNAQTETEPRLVVTADETAVFEADVSPVGNGSYHIGSGTFVAPSPTALLRFSQTKEGEHTLLLDDIRVTGPAVNLPCIQLTPSAVQIGLGQISSEISVKVLGDVVADGPATVTVTSSDPMVTNLPDAVDGELTLTFQADNLVQSVAIEGVARGAATLHFSESRGVCFDKPGIDVLVLGAFVRNPSFENNSHPSYPGYGPIDSWASDGGGNTGINGPDGPFHDNGVIPDRGQVALLQTSKLIRQEIVGLTPRADYALQFYYNARNCCGGTIDLLTRFDGNEVGFFPDVQPVTETNPYHFVQLEFTASDSSGLLEFETVATGDATVLLDAVTIIERASGVILVRNPSFEASGIVPDPGGIEPQDIAGWVTDGAARGVNISGGGPFADNGLNPDQDSVLFLQGEGTYASQPLPGITAEQNYTVRFAANAPLGHAPILRVALDDYVGFEETIDPVGQGNPYREIEVVLQATATEGVLRFQQTATGDQTVLIDDVTVFPGGVLPPKKPRLNIETMSDSRVRVSWPADADGFVLQSTLALNGEWTDAPETVSVEGLEKVVFVAVTEATRFFRLRD